MDTADAVRMSRTVPYGVGYDLEKLISKDMWRELALDMIYAELGEDASLGEVTAAITTRLDTLHSNGIVLRRLPVRFPRTDPMED